MAQINVSEDDFCAVAGAARDALHRGDRKDADRLDKIARKINAALTAGRVGGMAALHGGQRSRLSWRDMPSTLDV